MVAADTKNTTTNVESSTSIITIEESSTSIINIEDANNTENVEVNKVIDLEKGEDKLNDQKKELEDPVARNINNFLNNPYFGLMFIPCILFASIVIPLCAFVIDKDAPEFSSPFFAKVVAVFMLFTYCYLLFEKVHYYSVAGFYEIFWFCNSSLVFCAIGLWFTLPSLIGMTLIMVFFPHLGFYFDVLCWLVCRKCPVGAGGFFFDKNYPTHTKVASLHHFWYLPAVFFLFYHYPYFNIWVYVLSMFFFSWNQIFCHYLIPEKAPNAENKMIDIDICVSRQIPECLRNIYPFKLASGRPIYALFLVGFFCYAIPVNGIAYGLIYLIQMALQN
ncbi:hypothetical protein WA158_000183 [Blastocystis sp. Blastoise]